MRYATQRFPAMGESAMQSTVEAPSHCTSQGPGALRRSGAGLLAALLLAMAAAPAWADEYDPAMAGHPLRIIAYVVHPLGVLVDYLVMRPAHWVGNHEPFSTIFGHQLDD
jgi:hypothetical protein